jgi:hypothetical protein
MSEQWRGRLKGLYVITEPQLGGRASGGGVCRVAGGRAPHPAAR